MAVSEQDQSVAGADAGESQGTRARFDLRSFGRDLAVVGPYALAAVALALALHDLSGRSFWIDEAALADYVRGERFLAAPPYYAAPVLHMTVLRGLVQFGDELIMRLPSALTIATAVGLIVQAGRLYGRSPCMPWIAGILMATNPLFVHYGREIKQYGFEAAYTALAIWTLLRTTSNDLQRRDFWLVMSLIAVVGMLVTFSWVIVLPAMILALAVVLLVARSREGIPGLAAFAGGCLVAALLLYFVVLRHQSSDTMVGYWHNWGGLYDSQSSLLAWLGDRFDALAGHTIINFPPSRWIVPALLVAGAARLVVNRSWALLTLCCGMIVLAFAYAIAGLYPFDGARLSLFLWPAMFLLIGAAIAWPFELKAARSFATPLVTIAILIALAAGARSARAAVDFNKTYHVEHIRPVIDQVRGRWHDGDVLLLYAPAKEAFDYYTEGETLWDRRSLSRHREPEYYREQVRTALDDPGVNRVWIIYSHVLRIQDVEALEFVHETPGLHVSLVHAEMGALAYRVERTGR